MAISDFFKTVSLHEIIMFMAVFSLFVLLGFFYHFNIVQLRVQEESNCLKESKLTEQNGVYNVIGKVSNRPAFQVSYDMFDKSTKIECACAEGEVQNNFTNIPYYDLKSTTPDNKRVKKQEKLECNCETNISADATDNNVSYYGDTGITNFMYDQNNKIFFDNILHGANYEYVS